MEGLLERTGHFLEELIQKEELEKKDHFIIDTWSSDDSTFELH